MEKQNEGGTKTWVIASIFFLFGVVLSLLLINSGITGNAIFNIGGMKTTITDNPSLINNTNQTNATFFNITKDITLGEICSKIEKVHYLSRFGYGSETLIKLLNKENPNYLINLGDRKIIIVADISKLSKESAELISNELGLSNQQKVTLDYYLNLYNLGKSAATIPKCDCSPGKICTLWDMDCSPPLE